MNTHGPKKRSSQNTPNPESAAPPRAGQATDAKTTGPVTTEPSAFELTLVAAILLGKQPHIDSVDKAIDEATRLWERAEASQKARREGPQELNELLDGIFKMPDPEWNRRLDSYSGDKDHLNKVLSGQGSDAREFSVEIQVLPGMFRGRNQTRKSRAEKLGAILEFAGKNEFPLFQLARSAGIRFEKRRVQIPGTFRSRWEEEQVEALTVEKLLNANISALAVRELVEAREAMVSRAHSHPKKTT